MTIRIFFSIFLLNHLIFFHLFNFTHQFSEETIKFSVSEDAKLNTIIGHLEAEIGYTYRLSRGNSKIKFDEQTLELSVSSPLDRESENAIDMLIITSPPSIIHILIDVLDVNDNSPIFPIDVQRVEIPETAPIGWRVQISGATDPDEGKNGTIGKYELVDSLATVDTMSPFGIVQSDGFLFLEVTGKLDRETRDLYSMRLTAIDQGVPELSSSCHLNILILDINDNPPNFGIRSLTLNWNGLPNTKLFSLNATDLDSNENSLLTYRILPSGPTSEMFSISDENILVTQNNTECLQRCEFVVEARDSGVPPLSTTLNIVVNMEYGNEHEPNINIRFYPSDYPFIIVQPEDVNGKTLAILSITDSDGPLGANSTIWIENGNEQSIFSLISRQSINILTVKHVENANQEYILEFRANDGQSPADRITRKELKIFFKKYVKSQIHVERESHVTVEKDTVPGSFVAHVETNCTDMCSFELANSDVFKIDPFNGIIVTSSILPEGVTSYHLPIRIHLPPPSTQLVEADVFVKVIQESVPKNLIRSSESPIHLKRAYTFTTWQDVSLGTVIGRLPKAQIYSTIDTVSELGVFPDGSVFVGKTITSDFVTLPVTLVNRNTTQTSIITLIVKPLNQHSPICQITEIHVLENAPIGTIFGRIQARDEDSGLSGVVSYKILTKSDDYDGIFHLDSTSGSLRSLKAFDAEKKRSYTFEYEAKDLGTPSKTTNCPATIFIEDVNDNVPKFGSRYYTATISGKSNETVAIVQANDNDVDVKNQKLQYHLLNYHDFFQLDKETGKVTTIQDVPMTWQRLNISISAVNMDSERFLQSKTFLLVTVTSSSKLAVQLNSGNLIRIFKNDKIGEKVGHLDIASSETVYWSTLDPRLHVDSSGNIILIRRNAKQASTGFDIILTSENGEKTEKVNFEVEFVDSERSEDVEKVMDIVLNENTTEVSNLMNDWKNWKISRVILENANNSGNNTFFLEHKKLWRTKNATVSNAIILESEDQEGSPKSFKLLHVTTSPSPSSESSCISPAHLISPPSTVPLPSNCSNVKLQNLKTSLQIHENNLLIPTQSELINHVDLVSTQNSDMKPFMMTLIKDYLSEDVRFSTNNVLMLLSSIHPIGTSFGRVTAESGYRRYYIVGTDKISIDADTGELILKERFYRNLNDILIVAVIPKGIAKAKITIEVIEDRLILPQSNFFIPSPPSFNSKSKIGKIPIDRDDVTIDVIDEHFYVRNFEIFVKRHFIPNSNFYDLKGTVKKGKLSAPISVTLFFGEKMKSREIRENELMFEIEENSPIGTVVGVVPNSDTTKYRLVDPTCGLLIDQEGIIRTTTVFDRENTSLLKTKMIEPSENRIWNLLIFIADVNDNKPKILNAPGRIIVYDDLNYKLEWEDLDAIASDVSFSIVDGDVFGNLEIEDSGVISLNSIPNESFNATIRIYDNRPPFKVHFDDVTIEFQVTQKLRAVTCEDAEFWMFFGNEDVGMLIASEIVTWRIVPQIGSDSFKIDPITGIIQSTPNTKPTSDIAKLKIQAISYDGERVGFCDVKIHIDKAAFVENVVLSNGTFEFNISETADRFTEVGKIVILGAGLEGSVFRIQDNDYNFTISPFDGTIFTNSPLDFENIKTYRFNITAGKSTSQVIIHVTDENDEAPRFITGDVVNLKVLEELDTVSYPLIIGSSIAEDLDEGQNGLVTYSILSGNTSLFAVNSTTGDILSLIPLDREESSLHELLIEAKDAGIPSLSATSKILIHVGDINDNTPEFELSSYFIKISENSKIGSKIIRILATDKDKDAELQYSLESNDEITIPFRINVATGWITVAGKVNREENEEFRFFVKVTDGEKSSKVIVEIHVEDFNDNHPMINDRNSDIFVPDPTRSVEIIHVINVHDLDKSDHLKFSLNNSNLNLSENGEITLKSPLQTAVPVRVTVSDDAGHVAFMEYLFHPHSRKHFPVFVEKLDTVSVREHDEQELAVFKANGDSIRYSIVSRCSDHLEMEKSTGILKTKSSLDAEEYSECLVFIIATTYFDNKPLSTITKATIKIVDINDNSPRFDQQLYRFNVTENSGPKLIGHVIARDIDRSSRVFYEIVGGDANHEFMVTESGQIESVRDLDRETKSEYHLIVEAIDDGKPRRRGNTTVIVTVLDEDDNAPRFSRIFHVEVPEDVRIGEPVIQLSASDADEHSNHRFELDGGGEGIPFRVDENTGMVFVNDSLDFEKKQYRIKVKLTDGAWLIETSLFVNVKDVNDNAPIFEKPEYLFISEENSAEIGQFHASDMDSENNGKRYSVTSPYFKIEPSTGVLSRFRQQLPQPLMSLKVTATDHGVPRLQKTVLAHLVDKSSFGKIKQRRIRETTKVGDVIGKKIDSGATIFPLDVATVTRDGDVVLKKNATQFWILENDTIYEFVKTDAMESTKNENITLNITSDISMNSDNFKVLRNGSLIVFGFSGNQAHLKIQCDDGFWPKQDRKIINLVVNNLDADRNSFPLARQPTIRKSMSLPKTMILNIPFDSPTGTIIWKNLENAVQYMENQKNVNFSNGSKNLILKTPLEETMQIDIFGQNFERSALTITPNRSLMACPVFQKNFYFFESVANLDSKHPTEIHNFGWSSDEIKGCQIDIFDKTHLFYQNGSSLIFLKPLLPGTYQFSLQIKSQSDSKIRSACHVVVTVIPPTNLTTWNIPSVIFATRNYNIPNLFHLPSGYSLSSDQRTFSLIGSGTGKNISKLSSGVYQVNVVGKDEKKEIVRILLDDVADDVTSKDIEYHVVSSTLSNLKIPTPIDVECFPRTEENLYEITKDCRLLFNSDVINTTIPVVTSPANSTWNLRIINESPETVKSLENNAVSLEIITQKSSIPRLITDLRVTYSDMKIYCLGTWQTSEDIKYHITFVIVDRNGVVIEESEARQTLTSFLKKHRPGYLDFVDFDKDPCDGVTCIQKNSTCQPTLVGDSASRLVSRSSSVIFDLPLKKLTARCFCSSGIDCYDDTTNETIQKTQKINVITTCDDIDCGPRGKCFMEESSQPICRCGQGFESMYSCERADDVFSMSTGGSVEISVRNGTSHLLKCSENCDGRDIQKIEFDFRTVQLEKSELFRVDFGKQVALIELIGGSLTFSITDAYARPIETRIEKRVNDGRWHRLLFQMSEDGRRISIQVNGRGKEVKSRVPLQMLFTAKKIQLMTPAAFCFRRLLAQNQFVHPILNRNKFFEISSTGTSRNECQFDSIQSGSGGFRLFSNFSNTTTLILLITLALISLIGFSVCLLAIRRRWRQKSPGDQKQTERSNGWTGHVMPRRRGHINRSMVKSPDDDTYDVATVYGMKSTSTDDITHIYTSSSSRRYQPPTAPSYRRDGHINMAYL
uniref:Cadherin 3 n=1 Tax=Caenorhabditis elegans TaxID=6239 RepID=Q9TWY4_CAEEL|nr:cadherin 3 [Caenorhabditis elegans, Peptide, 3337 aa] [Caenorhabditis elegans]